MRRNSVDEIQLIDESSKRGVVESNVEGNYGGQNELNKKGTIVKAVVVTQETSMR